MTDFLKIAKSIVVHFAHICAYGVETVKAPQYKTYKGRGGPVKPSMLVSTSTCLWWFLINVATTKKIPYLFFYSVAEDTDF